MRRGILSHCLRIFLICWAIGTFYVLFEEIVPVTRTHFLSFQSFRKRADFTTYPNELPVSAHDIKYYYYEGFFADKSGYHVSYFLEDYELMREKRLESYNPDFPWEVYCYDGGEKLYLEREKMKDKKIDFLDILIPEKQDSSQYYFLAYDLFEDDQVYSYEGVLCNDETYEMVEFSCRCPN